MRWKHLIFHQDRPENSTKLPYLHEIVPLPWKLHPLSTKRPYSRYYTLIWHGSHEIVPSFDVWAQNSTLTMKIAPFLWHLSIKSYPYRDIMPSFRPIFSLIAPFYDDWAQNCPISGEIVPFPLKIAPSYAELRETLCEIYKTSNCRARI